MALMVRPVPAPEQRRRETRRRPAMKQRCYFRLAVCVGVPSMLLPSITLLPKERITPPCVAMPVPLPKIFELSRRMVDVALAANTPFVTLLLMVLRSTSMLIGLVPAVTMPVRLVEMTLSRTVMVIGPELLFAAIPLLLNWILLFSMMTRALPPGDGWIAMPPPVDG